jgi:hypothetical protein
MSFLFRTISACVQPSMRSFFVRKESLLCSYRFLFELESEQVMKSFQGLSGYLHGGRAPAGTRGLADVVDTLLQDGVLQHWLGR